MTNQIDHSNCDHPRTPSGRAACRRRRAGGSPQATPRAPRKARPEITAPEVWSYAKIKQEAMRRASAWQKANFSDLRSFAEIHFNILADLRDRYAR